MRSTTAAALATVGLKKERRKIEFTTMGTDKAARTITSEGRGRTEETVKVFERG